MITDLQVGGVPLHLLRVAGHFRGAGHEVTVVSLKPAGPVAARLEEAGVSVRSCGVTSAVDWRVFERLAGYIRDAAPDLVHSFLFHANNAARVACILCGFPKSRLICEIQTAEIERRWHLLVDRFTHRFCRFTIGNSPSVIEHLHAQARIPRDRLRLVMGGIDVEAIRDAQPLPRSELGVGENDTLLLWVGRLDPVKGIDTLLAAMECLESDEHIKLLLVGDGELRRSIESEIVERKLEGTVTLLGQRDDVPGLLRTADVFVFPSRTEGMPNALLEAMAASLAVVATDVGGCHDIVTHEETGLLIPVDDSEALAGAIRTLIGDPPVSRGLGDKACHYVFEQFTTRACCRRYAQIYSEVLAVGHL